MDIQFPNSWKCDYAIVHGQTDWEQVTLVFNPGFPLLCDAVLNAKMNRHLSYVLVA